MIATIRSEWIKIRTVRMNLVLCIIAVAIPLLVSVLTSALVDPADSIDAAELVGAITGSSVITAMLLGVIGVVSIGGEFSHGTIRPTFAATPRRGRVLLAKGIVTSVTALVIEVVVVALCYGIAAAILSSRGANISLADYPEARNALIGIVAFAMIVALLGYGLGMLIRNMPSAIAVLILWPLVIENIVAGLLSLAGVNNPFKWLPYVSGIQLGDPDSGTGRGEFLSRIPAGLYFGGVTLAVIAMGAALTNRRDA